MEDEPLLVSNPRRFVIFPIEYQDIWDFYKRAVASFWTAEEIDVGKDILSWNSLTNDERHFVSHALALFAVSDKVINRNLVERLSDEIQVTEARCFYGFEVVMENIHSEIILQLIRTYVRDPVRKAEIFQNVENWPCFKKKYDWSKKWVQNEQLSFAERLAAFAVYKGVFFSACFASFSWFQTSRGLLLHGLTNSNKLISRDKALHCDFACLLFTHIRKKPSQERIEQMVTEAVQIEQEFFTDILPVKAVGLEDSIIKEYVEFVADQLLLKLGYSKNFNRKNPFESNDEMISFEKRQTNSFDKAQVTFQQKAGVSADRGKQILTFDADF